jgi:hypothetical protein
MKNKLRFALFLSLFPLLLFTQQPGSNVTPQCPQYAPPQKNEAYYPNQFGSLHWITGVYEKDKSIVIECGAEFTFRFFDGSTASSWKRGTLIQISPAPWLSYCEYKLTNLMTGKSVHADITKGPNEQNPLSKKIIAFNANTRDIVLNDGTQYRLGATKKELKRLEKWEPGQFVVVGNNDEWFQGQYNYILINEEADNYVTAYQYK